MEQARAFDVGHRVVIVIRDQSTWGAPAVLAMNGVLGVVEEVKQRYGPWPEHATGYLVRFDVPVTFEDPRFPHRSPDRPRAAFHFLGEDLRPEAEARHRQDETRPR